MNSLELVTGKMKILTQEENIVELDRKLVIYEILESFCHILKDNGIKGLGREHDQAGFLLSDKVAKSFIDFIELQEQRVKLNKKIRKVIT